MTALQNAMLEDVEGVVKWFDSKKGYGFIVGPEEQDIFVHYSRIQGEGFRVLRDGASVRYSAERSERGWSATRVERIDDEAEGHSRVSRGASHE